MMQTKLILAGRQLTKTELVQIHGGGPMEEALFRFYNENTICQNGSKVWMLEDVPTESEWEAFISEPC